MKYAMLALILVLAMAVPAFAEMTFTHGSASGNVAAAGTVAASGAVVCGSGYASAGGGAIAIANSGCRNSFAFSKSGGGSYASADGGFAAAGQIAAGGAIAGKFHVEWCSVEFGGNYVQ